jgi:TolB-like protein/tetratricopeptide (TPR) repeat protein
MDEKPQYGAFLPDLVRLPGYTIDLRSEELRKESGERCELRPQAFAVLKYLALNIGRLVTKEELLAEVWRGMLVTDDSLVQAIGDIRRALNDSQHRVIKTLPRRGYMLIAVDLLLHEDAVAKPAVPDAMGSASRRCLEAMEPGSELRQSPEAVAGDTVAATASALQPRQTRAHPAVDYLSRLVAWPLLGGIVFALFTFGAWFIFHANPAATSNTDTLPSIAVLPFKGEPAGVGSEELAREVASDLVSELARSPEIRVVSTQSSFRFPLGQTPVSEIGHRLRCRYLIEGTVRRDAEQLRIVVQLLDSQDGQVMWTSSQTVDRTTLGAVPHMLIGRVAGTLEAKMTVLEERRAISQPPKSLDVVVLTARAKSMMLRYSAEGVREARSLLEQALSIDPNYAPAWAILSVTNTIDYGLHLTGEISRNRASEVLFQARRAVALRPDMPKSYAALSDAEGIFGNFDAALAAAQQCLRLSPNDDLCFYVLATSQLRLGQVDPAIRNFEQALDRNPLPQAALPAFYATALWAAGRLEEAVKVADACLARAPDFWRCQQERIVALAELRRRGEAQEEADRLRAKHPEMTSRQFRLLWDQSAAALGERRSAVARSMGFP